MISWRRHRAWLLVGLTVLLVLVVRVRLRSIPLERDEGEYAYAGQLILQGVPPYQYAYNMKLPGTYAAYALIMAIFGQTASGIHVGLALVNAASVVLVFLIGRKLADETTGVAAAVAFALLSMTPLALGLAAHATHFIVLPALGGILLLLKGTKTHEEARQDSKTLGCAPVETSSSEPRIGRSELPPPKPQELQTRTIEVKDQRQEAPAAGFQGQAKAPAPTAPTSLWALPVFLKLRRHREYSVPSVYAVSTLFLSGLLFGVAFVMKQHGALFGLFGLLYLAWTIVEPRLFQDPDAKWAAPKPRAVPKNRPSTAPLAPPPLQPARRSILAQSAARASNNSPASNAAPGQVASHPVEERAKVEGSERQQVVQEPRQGRGVLTGSQTSQVHPATTMQQIAVGAPGALDSNWDAVLGMLAFVAGLALPYAFTCITLLLAGVFPQFFFWTFSYARKYASIAPLAYGPQMFKTMFNVVLGPNLALWLLPLGGALLIWWDQRLKVRHRFLLAALLICSLASVSIGLYFREHYFILLLPVLSLLSGIAFSRALLLLKHDRSIELFLAVPVLLLFVLGVLAALIGNGSIWFALPARQAAERIYATTLFADAATVADYIRTNSSKDARVAVVGSEPEIYFYSHRRSATGYIYTYPLMEAQPYAAQMQQSMIDEIERAKPEYVVYVNNPLSWLPQEGSDQHILRWWDRYWATNLELVTTINTRQGPELRNELRPVGEAQGAEGNYVLLLKRRK